MVDPWRTATFRALNTPLGEVLGGDTAKPFEALRVYTVGDLYRHVPRRYLSGTELSDLGALRVGDEVAVAARVRSVNVLGYGEKARIEATITDGHGELRLTFFGRPHLIAWWKEQLELARSRANRGIFAGKVGVFQQRPQLAHPNFVVVDEDNRVIGAPTRPGKGKSAAQLKRDQKRQDFVDTVRRSGLLGLYPQSAKLPTWTIAASVQHALEVVGPLEEWLPPDILRKARVLGLQQAIEETHLPQTVIGTSEGVARLRFDEAFATQLTMAKRRADAAKDPATAYPRRRGGLLESFDARLPFTLTKGQVAVGEQVFADLAGTAPMQRLLQGEVGSGKTIVALRAMLAVVDGGGQAALLAPTEVLAQQHAASLRAMLGDLAMAGELGGADVATRVALVTGSMPAAARRAAADEVARGEAGIVVGTHALLGERVEFANLGLVVVDEQHRFGVEQRAALAAKAATRPHVLVMTATPIPRSVAMTIFGDLATSTLTEIPAGRAPVTTTVVDVLEKPAWVDRAWARVREEVNGGRQAFIVAPRIGERAKGTDEDVGDDASASVVDLYEHLRTGPLASLRVGMLHGGLPTDAKSAIMAEFVAGDVDVLVATTVIEVGVDVPNASVMVVSDADRFGISQLHQLRGRIGRGAHPGVCLLLTRAEPDSTARDRLDAVASTRDGFVLAEVDLEQRREGDVLGAAQAGTRSSLRLLRVTEHADIIERARELAADALRRDPDLTHPGLADAVTQTELLAAGDWLERN